MFHLSMLFDVGYIYIWANYRTFLWLLKELWCCVWYENTIDTG